MLQHEQANSHWRLGPREVAIVLYDEAVWGGGNRGRVGLSKYGPVTESLLAVSAAGPCAMIRFTGRDGRGTLVEAEISADDAEKILHLCGPATRRARC